MQNMQSKYTVARNLNVVYHDPETGQPRIVIEFIYMAVERALWEKLGEGWAEAEVPRNGGDEASRFSHLIVNRKSKSAK
jgi:hypothetical protein